MRNFCKNIDIWLSYCEIYILEIWPHQGEGGGDGTFLITVMLIYRHWVIMAYSNKMSDIIVLKKCEVYSTENVNIAFALA